MLIFSKDKPSLPNIVGGADKEEESIPLTTHYLHLHHMMQENQITLKLYIIS
jgi:hypothetical protein